MGSETGRERFEIVREAIEKKEKCLRWVVTCLIRMSQCCM